MTHERRNRASRARAAASSLVSDTRPHVDEKVWTCEGAEPERSDRLKEPGGAVASYLSWVHGGGAAEGLSFCGSGFFFVCSSFRPVRLSTTFSGRLPLTRSSRTRRPKIRCNELKLGGVFLNVRSFLSFSARRLRSHLGASFVVRFFFFHQFSSQLPGCGCFQLLEESYGDESDSQADRSRFALIYTSEGGRGGASWMVPSSQSTTRLASNAVVRL